MQRDRNNSAMLRLAYSRVLTTPSLPKPGCDDLLERAFQLAYFIVQDRSVAIEVVDRARKRLTAEQSREKKRLYWRHRRLKQKIRRITRDGQDALQWLIYLESERYERLEEQKGRPSKRSLGVRYIKSIVQMTSNISCFYVAVGLHRILHNYTTPDIQAAYELFTEDFAGGEKYRRVKRALMQKLARRFSGFITIRQWDNQELRFDVDEKQQDWAGLASSCLEMFTPWSTRNACLPPVASATALRNGSLSATSSRGAQPGVDVEEMKKCHIFIHPPCFDELTRRLKLAPRPARLAMPRFTMSQDRRFEDESPWETGSAPPLTSEERAVLTQPSETGQPHHLQKSPQLLTITADGVPCAQLDLSHETRKQWKIDEGTRLIEFCAENTGTTQVLAMHWVDYTDTDGIAAGEHTIAMGSGRELVLKTVPADPGSDQAGGATMLLRVSPASHWASWKDRLQSLVWHPRLPGYALAGMLILLGWAWSIYSYRQIIVRQQSIIAKAEQDRASAEAAAAALRRQLNSAPLEARSPISYRLLPDSRPVRGLGNMETPVITFSGAAILAQLELPVYGSDAHAMYRATLRVFSGKTEVLREDRLTPTRKDKGFIVVFALPPAAVKDQTRYVITLESMNAPGPKRVGDFSFYVQKQ
ncbi:MAG TPA: hypothetical protein VKY85_01810 [Candidatus Angelobacter sp.]|nr:hypothetical protein [Candidatus Angelobacter sp.]